MIPDQQQLRARCDLLVCSPAFRSAWPASCRACRVTFAQLMLCGSAVPAVLLAGALLYRLTVPAAADRKSGCEFGMSKTVSPWKIDEVQLRRRACRTTCRPVT